MTKESAGYLGDGDPVGASEERRARRAVARVNGVAQDHRELCLGT